MTTTGTFTKTLRTVLLLTVLSPVPVFAGTVHHPKDATTVQPSTGGEVKKTVTRSLSLGDPTSLDPNGQQPVMIPANAAPEAKIDASTVTSNASAGTPGYQVAGAPTAAPSVSTASVVTLPAPPVAADTIQSMSSSIGVANTQASTTDTAVAPVQNIQANSTTQTADTQTTATVPVVTTGDTGSHASANTPAAKTDTAVAGTGSATGKARTKVADTHAAAPHHRAARGGNYGQFNTANLGRQFQSFISQPQVQSLIAQYLN